MINYQYIGNGNHEVFGEYRVSEWYPCIEDHSLLDTQIKVIDDSGCIHWEDVSNFKCEYTPYVIYLHVVYQLDEVGTEKHYVMRRVWYEELTINQLKEAVKKQLNSHYPIQILDAWGE